MRGLGYTDAIVKYVQENPGKTAHDIREALSLPISLNSINNLLSRLSRFGVLKNRGGKGRANPPAAWYVVETTASNKAVVLAREIYTGMQEMPAVARERYLAERLDEVIET